MNSREGLNRLLRECNIETGSEPALKLQAYLALLEKWNPRINLTANLAWTALEPLFREGIWAAARYSPHYRAHLDIGSGAGFPALILRIFKPEMRLELVESRGKKGAFLETAAWELDLPGTRVHIKRLEEVLADSGPEKIWDCVSWKAIRIASRDLRHLCRHLSADSRLWMFHGQEAAVEEPQILDRAFIVTDKWPLPGQNGSFLSIYRAIIRQS